MRLVVTALAVGLLADAYTWVDVNGGPQRAFAFLFAVLAAGLAVLAIVWAWKRHPF